jgi:hypothetical protein
MPHLQKAVGGECAVKKYIITIEPEWTRIYPECYEQPTFFPADYEAGTPARLEVSGQTVLEFEGDASIAAV